MFAISIWTKRLIATGAALAALMFGTHPCGAQRPEPKIVDYGLPESGKVVHGRLVQWGDWGVRLDGCVRRPTDGTECKVSVLNGTSAEHSLCLGDAALLFADAKDTTNMAVVRQVKLSRPTDLEQHGYQCARLAAHTEQEYTFRSTSAIGRRASSLGITLVERQNNGPAFKARTKLPLVGSEF